MDDMHSVHCVYSSLVFNFIHVILSDSTAGHQESVSARPSLAVVTL